MVARMDEKVVALKVVGKAALSAALKVAKLAANSAALLDI